MDKNGLQATIIYVVNQMGLIFFLYPSDLFAGMDTGHWIGILSGYLVHVAAVYLFVKGRVLAQNKNITQLFLGTGRISGILLMLPAFIYMFCAFTLTLRTYSEMLILVFLSNTPVWSVILLLIIVAYLFATYGISSIGRTAVLLIMLFSIPILFILCLAFQNVDWYYLLPIVEKNQSFSFLGNRSFLMSLFIYTGSFLFLGFLPKSMSINQPQIRWASILLLPMYLLSVYLPLITFGHSTAKLYEFPMLMSVDTINVTWLMFDRVTSFFLLSLMAFAMLYLGVTLWVLSAMIGVIRPLKKSRPIWIMFLTICLFVFSLLIPNWDYLKEIQAWLIPFKLYTLIVIPLLTFGLGWRYNHKQRLRRRHTE
ncbi:spore germination protein [Neobacillus mesonae]|nr:spore germination protein [Neobacillus mesonae]